MQTDKGALGTFEGAGYLSIGRTKLYELINAGEIRTVKVGSRTLIPRSELDAWLQRQLASTAAGR